MQDKQITRNFQALSIRKSQIFHLYLSQIFALLNPKLSVFGSTIKKEILNVRHRQFLAMHLLVHMTKEKKHLSFGLVNYYNTGCRPCLELKIANTARCQAI